jgi:DNA-directed RNA polymerase subunit beta'
MTPLNRGQLLTEDDYLAKVEEYGDDFDCGDGRRRHSRAAPFDRHRSREVEKLRSELETTTSETKIKKFSKRLKVLEAFRSPASSPSGWCSKCCRCCRRICVRWCRWTVAASRPPT